MENQSENNDIDDVIIPTAPLYKQILNLYAEENAIEDTIFYLGEALRRGVIDLEVFLKVCSSLYFSLFREQCRFLAFIVLLMLCLTSSFVFFCPQHVRLLSRKQFQLRALMQKARKTAGLSDLYWPRAPALITRARLGSSLSVVCQWEFSCLWSFTSVRVLATVPDFIFLIRKRHNGYDIWTLKGKN